MPNENEQSIASSNSNQTRSRGTNARGNQNRAIADRIGSNLSQQHRNMPSSRRSVNNSSIAESAENTDVNEWVFQRLHEEGNPSVQAYRSFQHYISEMIWGRGGELKFLGIHIRGGINAMFWPKLLDIEERLGYSRLVRNQHNLFGIGGISGYTARGGLHSWGLAIDIDTARNPYIMHQEGERVLDAHLAEIYHRISRFILGRDSVIPNRISQGRIGRTSAEKIDSALSLYDRLQQESTAMSLYFYLMQNPDDLANYLRQPIGRQNYMLAMGWVGGRSVPYRINQRHPDALSIPRHTTNQRHPDASSVQRQMMADWAILDSGRNRPALRPLVTQSERPETAAITQYPTRPPITESREQSNRGTSLEASHRRRSNASSVDPPFAHRIAPSAGFLNLRRELVEQFVRTPGIRWGAIDFGEQSGDVMHFDLGYESLGQRILYLYREFRRQNRRR